MIRAHTIRLNPTPEQESLFRQAAGTARFCYNWGLRVIKDALDQGVTVPMQRSLRDAFKRIRATEFPWTFTVGKSAIDGAFVNLGRAIKNFFDSRNGRRKGKKVGFPAFKSRRRGYGSFYVANGRTAPPTGVQGTGLREPSGGNWALRGIEQNLQSLRAYQRGSRAFDTCVGLHQPDLSAPA